MVVNFLLHNLLIKKLKTLTSGRELAYFERENIR